MRQTARRLISSSFTALSSIFCALILATPIVHADKITWTGTEDGEWSNSNNWDLNRIPVSGDDLVFPADAPNKTQNAFTIGTSSDKTTISFEGGGYVLNNTNATIMFGFTFDSIGDNTINCKIHHQNSPTTTSTDGTLTLNNNIASKGLTLGGNGNYVFNGNVTAGARQLNFYSTGVVRFQTGLAQFSHADGIRIFNSGTMLINCTQASGTLRYLVGGSGTLGGNGSIQVTTNGTAGTGMVTIGSQTTPAGSGTLSPGDPEVNDGIGTFTIRADDKVVLGSDANNTTGTLAIAIGDAGSVDLLAIEGNLDLSSNNNILSLTAAVDVEPAGNLTFLTFTGSRTGEFSEVYFNDIDITANAESGFQVGNKKFKLVYEGESDGLIKLVDIPSGTIILIK